MQPHQRTPVKFALLGQLLVASGGYDASSTDYLVKEFRHGFHHGAQWEGGTFHQNDTCYQ